MFALKHSTLISSTWQPLCNSMRATLVFAGAWFSITCAFAQSGIAESAPNVGASLYVEHCAVCHGEKGDGMTRARRGLNPPPRDFTTALAKAELSRERMIQSVTQGRPNTAMMSFSGRLSSDQIEQVVDYIRGSFLPKMEAEVSDDMRRLARGKAIYTSNCGVCHGDDGNGAMWTQSSLNPPPRNFTTALAKEELSRERMINSISHGRPGTAMMSFKSRLADAEIEMVVDYIRDAFLGKSMTLAQATTPHSGSLRGSSAATPPPLVDADMSLPLPSGLVGDAEKGRTFFMSNCITCHGRDGDGNGPRASFIQPKPRNFLETTSRRTLNRPALFKSIGIGKVGTVMPAWSKVLTDQQIADVAEFVFQNFIRTGQNEATDNSEKKKAPG